MSKVFNRLPKNVIPDNYKLWLKFNLETFTFDGETSISVQVHEPTSQIVLNANNLEIKSANFTYSNGQVADAKSIELSAEAETVTFSFASQLLAGAGKLGILYKGFINEKLEGIHRTKYTNANGELRYAVSTQFEATDARRAFPCWDEPALRATFDVTVVSPKHFVTLSNMLPISEKEYASDSNLKEIAFSTSPIMPTYLVAVVAGEYEYVEDTTKDGVVCRVYTALGKKEQGRFGLHVTTKVLPYYSEYFNIKYPLPKVDLIAISDFAMGAMENWGLITYRETRLLVDTQISSASSKQLVALVVGHELAHQWFGNLVTINWWTHLWLNEGFASWIEYLCVDFVFPEYDIWSHFVSDVREKAMELDGLRSSHPIEVVVGHPSEIDEIFDSISYDKGACVIRMLHGYIGDESFRKGMHQYLEKHKYGSATTEDLWDSLEAASGKPVRTVMSTWTRQMGFPVIKVFSQQDGDTRIITVNQERYLADGSPVDADPSQWIVPINVSSSRDPKKIVKQFLLEGKSAQIVIEDVKPNEWIKLNPSSVGYYRCLYTNDVMESLLPSIRDRSLPPLDRLNLQNDLFAMVVAGRTSTVEIFKLLEAFVDEDSYYVWSSVCSCLHTLGALLSHTDYHDLFKSYARELLTNISNRLGWIPKKEEGELETMLRAMILGRMAVYGDESIVSEAKRRFESHCSGATLLPPDFRYPVYVAVTSHGDEKTFEAFLKLYREADMSEEKNRLAKAMSALPDEDLLRRLLKFHLTDEVRSQDACNFLCYVGFNKRGRKATWQFVKENFAAIRALSSAYAFNSLLNNVVSQFASEDMAVDAETFFTENPLPGSERSVQQALESVRLNERWLSRDSDAIKSYLLNRK